MKKIKLRSNIRATVSIPGSKSITHRAVIAASLAPGQSILENYLECEDTIHTIGALRNLGIAIETDANSLIIGGSVGKFQFLPDRKEIFMGNSGTSFRLLLSVVALGRHPVLNEMDIHQYMSRQGACRVEKPSWMGAKAASSFLLCSCQAPMLKRKLKSRFKEHWSPGLMWISPSM